MKKLVVKGEAEELSQKIVHVLIVFIDRSSIFSQLSLQSQVPRCRMLPKAPIGPSDWPNRCYHRRDTGRSEHLREGIFPLFRGQNCEVVKGMVITRWVEPTNVKPW